MKTIFKKSVFDQMNIFRSTLINKVLPKMLMIVTRCNSDNDNASGKYSHILLNYQKNSWCFDVVKTMLSLFVLA